MAAYKRDFVRHQGREIPKSVSGEELIPFFRHIYQKHSPDEITFVCIGTDRSTGDALGPLTGTLLEEHGVGHVVGTLSVPCDADTLEKRMAQIPAHQAIVAIDACLGPKHAAGTYYLSHRALLPAESVGGKLPPVGQYSVAAVVNTNGPRPYSILQMTSLHFVMGMSRTIADAALEAWKTR
ncbi:spore protease YyaC [Paenibacillus xylanilyticus]|uniref:Spore protease YyaC n=1 Tax=Paenibacillus xylanilyticus TaxID=248903 RepID=A0A7Y6BVU8_9BACL|nr:spore protease YyaC [Paenibacillus xylanilyticus]NUU75543.1 spore protease YyaC [Paenibacillus xylanilyticus]